MLTRIAAFEARYQLRSPLFYISFALFFLLTFGAVTVEDIQIGSKGNVNLNSPFAIVQTLALMNVFAIFIVTAFVANVVIRDDETGFAPILRATRIQKFDYLMGRFIGATAVAFAVLCAVPLAMLIGSFMPWLDAEKLGPLVLSHYFYALFVYGLPTLVVMAAGFFALATATRSMMWTYVGVVAFLVLFTLSRVMLRDPSFDTISALADPFGIGALNRITKYWTSAERNTQLPPLDGMLLTNRLLWLGIGAALLGLAYRLFRFEVKGSPAAAPADKNAKQDLTPSPKPLARPSTSGGTAWLQFKALTRFDMRYVFKSPAFFVLLAVGAFNAFGSLAAMSEVRGVSYLPVTRTVVEALLGGFNFIVNIIAIYYAGELVWRDRERRMHEIVDASAAPNWAFMLPKVLAIALVLLATFSAASLCGMLFQLAHGYTQVEPLSYLLWFIVPSLISAFLLAVMAVFVQALVPQKFVGWGVMLVLLVASIALGTAGFEHKLYIYADTARVPLSDMNGMGNFWIGAAWHQAYWLAFGAMLLVLSHLMWRRGVETRLRPRLSQLRRRLKGTPGLLLGGATVAWLGLGGWVFYNTNVLNEYMPQQEQERLMAEYEKTMLPFAKLPQPTITEVTLNVDLYPQKARAVTQGSYVIENQHAQALDTLHVQWDSDLQMQDLQLEGARLQKEYKAFTHRIYTLDKPLQPGEKRTLRFATLREQRGFVNNQPQTLIVPNGTFLNNFAVSPLLGVIRLPLLQDRAKRRKYGLPPELRMAKLEDDSANGHTYLRHDSTWVQAHITLSTDADQTPLAPGYTVSDTTANGRRTLVTRTDTPIHNFFSLQSARYAIKKDSVPGADGKPIELAVYYHPSHASNVQRMLDSMKVSITTFSEAFGPYQFRQARVLEFPAYASFAQAYAATMPYSEGIGFIQTFDEAKQDEKVDLVTYVTAHEVAHQWWAHQLVGADKQGSTMLSETFAQYSALMVMEKLYGKSQLRKFLKLELDRYLRERGTELVEELPLNRVEDQPYIHYRKGAVTLYALKELVGEAAVNQALRAMLAEFAFKSQRYPDTRDFLRHLRAQAGPQHDALITDLFEKITLLDLKASAATAKQRPDGKFDVHFTVEAKKFYADGKGKETAAELNEAIDLGAFTAEPGKKGYTPAAVLKVERRLLKSGKQDLTLVTDRLPKFVGVDPFNMRIDRNSDDNLTAVTLQ